MFKSKIVVLITISSAVVCIGFSAAQEPPKAAPKATTAKKALVFGTQVPIIAPYEGYAPIAKTAEAYVSFLRAFKARNTDEIKRMMNDEVLSFSLADQVAEVVQVLDDPSFPLAAPVVEVKFIGGDQTDHNWWIPKHFLMSADERFGTKGYRFPVFWLIADRGETAVPGRRIFVTSEEASIPVGLNSLAWDKLVKHMAAKDEQAVDELTRSGEVRILPVGSMTQALTIERHGRGVFGDGLPTLEVRFLSGPLKKKTGFVAENFTFALGIKVVSEEDAKDYIKKREAKAKADLKARLKSPAKKKR